jgi:hypothetical protein
MKVLHVVRWYENRSEADDSYENTRITLGYLDAGVEIRDKGHVTCERAKPVRPPLLNDSLCQKYKIERFTYVSIEANEKKLRRMLRGAFLDTGQ